MSSQKKPKDPLHNLKYIGYCAAFMPPGKALLPEFVIYAKTYLCIKNRVLFKDVIWDTYGDEEIMVEYFAHIFSSDSRKKEEFEGLIGASKSEYDEFVEFANKGIVDNVGELEDKAKEMDESISFSPNTLGD